MKTIEVKFTVDLDDPGQVEKFKSFLGEKESAPTIEHTSEKPKKKTPKKEKLVVEKSESSKDVTIQQVRDVLSTKVDNHRTTIKSKLTELGAPNVSNLGESKYHVFIDFLNNLS